ncbi:MAG: CapA family protein [Lachnospiraceae bacterium]|nr:CapA family protein [Lachnospiraceae bacterium]
MRFKRLLLIINLILMLLPVCGCGDKNENGNATAFVIGKSDEATAKDTSLQEGENISEIPVIIINTEEEEAEPIPSQEPAEEEEEEVIWDFDKRIFSKETKSPDQVVLTFAGDISFAEGYSNMSRLRDCGEDINGVIKPEVSQGLKESDIFMVNNEFPYSNRGTPKEGKTFTFRAMPESVRYLTALETDIVSLANNHAFDYGEDALLDSMDILKEADIPFVGAGRNIEEAMQPVYFKVNKKVIAITAATQIERTANPESREATEDSPGLLRTLDATKMVKCIETAEENSDFVIVFVHWGSENTDLVEASQRELARKYVDAGADLIIGAHPHCLQGFDYVNGVPVMYSLGNFWFNSRRVDTGYAKVTINTTDEGCSIGEFRFVPCIQNGCTTSLATGDEAVRILSYLQGISDHATVSGEGVIEISDTNHNIQNGQNTSPSKEYIRKDTEEETEEAPGMLTLPDGTVIDPSVLTLVDPANSEVTDAGGTDTGTVTGEENVSSDGT